MLVVYSWYLSYVYILMCYTALLTLLFLALFSSFLWCGKVSFSCVKWILSILDSAYVCTIILLPHTSSYIGVPCWLVDWLVGWFVCVEKLIHQTSALFLISCHKIWYAWLTYSPDVLDMFFTWVCSQCAELLAHGHIIVLW